MQSCCGGNAKGGQSDSTPTDTTKIVCVVQDSIHQVFNFNTERNKHK